ncbi:hypothetical protein [Methylobacter psychrophilus]|uniref:hypothetical protein n=1 Tax=Methylobacter psychrophilus TaxID=96941 RepID=UPI0021D489BF|nr:hypothetical protein [Methylobacter psychrophilus]
MTDYLPSSLAPKLGARAEDVLKVVRISDRCNAPKNQSPTFGAIRITPTVLASHITANVRGNRGNFFTPHPASE